MISKPLITCKSEKNLKKQKFSYLSNSYKLSCDILQAFHKVVFSTLCLVYYHIHIFFMLHYLVRSNKILILAFLLKLVLIW